MLLAERSLEAPQRLPKRALFRPQRDQIDATPVNASPLRHMPKGAQSNHARMDMPRELSAKIERPRAALAAAEQIAYPYDVVAMDGSGDLTTRFAAILASVAECDALHTQQPTSASSAHQPLCDGMEWNGMGATVGLGQ
jgi:hypothetical protein